MIINVPLDKITNNPWQTRSAINQAHVEELAADIRKNGLLQTPVGRMLIDDNPIAPNVISDSGGITAFLLDEPTAQVQLAFGHNRCAAIKHLQFAGMPVDLRSLTDEQMADMAWSENERRSDVTPIERALAIQQRIEDFSWTHAQVAEHLAVSRSVVSNSLRLLKLPDGVQDVLQSGVISERVAISLAGLYDLPKSLQDKAENNYNYDIKPSKIVKDTLAGKLTSDQVRDRIQTLLEYHGHKLQDSGWTIDDEFNYTGSQSPTCRDCPNRLKDRNVCLDHDCYVSRLEAFQMRYLEQASTACGIPINANINPSHGYGAAGMQEFDHYTLRKNGSVATIIDSKCSNLSLIFHDTYQSPGDPRPDLVPNFPKAQILCKKRTGYCTCLQAMQATVSIDAGYNHEAGHSYYNVTPTDIQPKSAQPSAEELAGMAAEAKQRKKEARAHLEFAINTAGEQIAVALETDDSKAWKRIAQAVSYSCGQETTSAHEIRKEIGGHLVRTRLPNDFKTTTEVDQKIAKILAEFGIKD